MDFKKIRAETDLESNDILVVSRRIPLIHSKLIEEYGITSRDYIRQERLYKKEFKKVLDAQLNGEENIDVFATLKNKEDREIYLNEINDNISIELEKLNKLKRDIKEIEKCIEYLKLLQNNIRTIVEYEKFRGGK